MIDRGMFFERALPIFGGHMTEEQVTGCEADLARYDKAPEFNLDALAYLLASDKWESWHTMQPVRETLAKTDAEARRRLAGVWYAKVDPVTGWSYYGRGKPQTTHKRNYARMTQALPQFGIDFVTQPEAMLRLDVATECIFVGMRDGLFTGAGLPLYFGPDLAPRYVAARAIVNGTDHAGDIAAIAIDFRYALGGPKPTRILQEGLMDSPEVENLQRALKSMGYAVGAVDGDFGPATRLAVQEYQRAQGLDPDGVAGPQTRAKLNV